MGDHLNRNLNIVNMYKVFQNLYILEYFACTIGHNN